MALSFRALAVDFDGTLTQGSRPSGDLLHILRRLRREGLRTVLVTGRIMAELRHAFPDVEEWFDLIVSENGAVLNSSAGSRRLAAPVPPILEDALNRREIPVRGGEVLLACDSVHDHAVLEEILRLGVECVVIRNRAALMVLPTGVNKGSGLLEALGELGVSHHDTIGVGDAQNDHSLIAACEVGVAVANAVDGLKEEAEIVLDYPDGEGLVDLLAGDLLWGRRGPPPSRWRMTIGESADGRPARLPGARYNLLVAGDSMAGKSYAAGLFAEQVIRLGYSALVLDLEGDHLHLADLRGVLVLGGEETLPPAETAARLFGHRYTSLVVDLSLLAGADQDRYVDSLLQHLGAVRERTGLPHWIVIDEAHRYLCPGASGTGFTATAEKGVCAVTYRPQDLCPSVTDGLAAMVLLGVPTPDFRKATEALLTARHVAWPEEEWSLGQAFLLTPSGEAAVIRLAPRTTDHVRHWHKYVEAELSPGLHFHFGDGSVSARNLKEFHRLLGTIAPSTLLFHARRSDFSRWVRQAIQDTHLAVETAAAEDGADGNGDAERLRRKLIEAIEARYFTP